MSKVVSLAEYRARLCRDDDAPTVVTRLRGRPKHLSKGSPEQRRELAAKHVDGVEPEPA